MSILFWIPALVAVTCAAALPFRLGLAAVVILLPVSNAYIGALAVGVLLLRWAITDLQLLAAPRRTAFVVGGVCTFLALAMAQSASVTSDLARLASEASQWVLGVGLFAAVVLSHRSESQQTLLRSLAVGAALLAACQLGLKFAGMSPDDDSSTPMLSPTNNYVSILALFGLVILPMAVPSAFSARARVLMACFALAASYLNESRAALVLTVAAVVFQFVLRIRDARALLALGIAAAGIAAFGALVLIRTATDDANSIGSLTNFQTNFSNLERIGILIYSWELFNAAPFGSGIGSSSDLYMSNPYTIGSYPDAHNMLAMLAVELGWLGVIAYAVLFAFLAFESLRLMARRDAGCLLPGFLLLNTFYDAMLFNGVLAVFFWIYLATVITRTKGAKQLMLLVPRAAPRPVGVVQ